MCPIQCSGDIFNYEGEEAKDWDAHAWSVEKGHESKRRLLCVADVIIPGHGKAFRVTQQMKQTVQC